MVKCRQMQASEFKVLCSLTECWSFASIMLPTMTFSPKWQIKFGLNCQFSISLLIRRVLSLSWRHTTDENLFTLFIQVQWIAQSWPSEFEVQVEIWGHMKVAQSRRGSQTSSRGCRMLQKFTFARQHDIDHYSRQDCHACLIAADPDVGGTRAQWWTRCLWWWNQSMLWRGCICLWRRDLLTTRAVTAVMIVATVSTDVVIATHVHNLAAQRSGLILRTNCTVI